MNYWGYILKISYRHENQVKWLLKWYTTIPSKKSFVWVKEVGFFRFYVYEIYRLAPGKEETAYMLLQTCIGIVGALFSPVGVVCVYILWFI